MITLCAAHLDDEFNYAIDKKWNTQTLWNPWKRYLSVFVHETNDEAMQRWGIRYRVRELHQKQHQRQQHWMAKSGSSSNSKKPSSASFAPEFHPLRGRPKRQNLYQHHLYIYIGLGLIVVFLLGNIDRHSHKPIQQTHKHKIDANTFWKWPTTTSQSYFHHCRRAGLPSAKQHHKN